MAWRKATVNRSLPKDATSLVSSVITSDPMRPELHAGVSARPRRLTIARMGTVTHYGLPGVFTQLAGIDSAAVADLEGDPVDVCAVVRSLVVQNQCPLLAGSRTCRHRGLLAHACPGIPVREDPASILEVGRCRVRASRTRRPSVSSLARGGWSTRTVPGAPPTYARFHCSAARCRYAWASATRSSDSGGIGTVASSASRRRTPS